MSDLGNKQIMARNIQHYMDINQKSRSDVCEAIGVKYTTFTDWVKGNTYPRIDKIELMANYFGITKSDLVEAHMDEEAYGSFTINIMHEFYGAFGYEKYHIIDVYDHLDNDGKKELLNYIDYLIVKYNLQNKVSTEEMLDRLYYLNNGGV